MQWDNTGIQGSFKKLQLS